MTIALLGAPATTVCWAQDDGTGSEDGGELGGDLGGGGGAADDDLGLEPDTMVDDTTNPKDPEIQKPAVDPFRALIQPKQKPIPVARTTPVVAARPPAPTAPPPVNFNVVAVAGEEPNYVAVIEYKGNSYIVSPGEKVPDDKQTDFEVKQVTAEKVEVYDHNTQRLVRKRLPVLDLGGGDGGP